ncbi:hypothetical protein HIM_03325 [Hirsutella minnesotensis 3608]|uniref:LysM domain-containing protein n=1 Tax=Hirsutella minnesotensis 3608 TaxID=1043627 RepID=A0A0F8A6F8_9HYPO|nr:hypothetical protein HIM_03325 [Hirsutella minnesotensis 3608]
MGLLSLGYAVFLGSQCFHLTVARILGRNALPSLPKADSVTPHCTWWYDHESQRQFQDVLQENSITLEQFRRWNPTIGTAGEGWTVGRAYCVEAAFEPTPEPAAPQVPNSPPSSGSIAPVENAPNGPTPSQPGRISTCTAFYKTMHGDSCQDIVNKYGTFTLDEFYRWNPAVGADCRNLWTDVYVCVGILGTPTSKPQPTDSSPIRPGMMATCDKVHFAVADDNCWSIAQKYRIELDDL